MSFKISKAEHPKLFVNNKINKTKVKECINIGYNLFRRFDGRSGEIIKVFIQVLQTCQHFIKKLPVILKLGK